MLKIKEFITKNIQKCDYCDLELLLCFVLNKEKSFLISNNDYQINQENLDQLNKLLDKRKKWYSIAALIWKKEFYSINFQVSKDTLIPRPETEILIEEVLKIIKINSKINSLKIESKFKIQNSKLTLLDIGTWTWCIPITIWLKSNNDINITASDISKKALTVAKKNAKAYWIKIKFIQSDLFENMQEKDFDIITANLPYVPIKDKNPSIEKEPDLALYSWEDWLDHYKRLAFEIIEKWIKFKYLFLEIAPFQSEQISLIFSQFWNIEIIKDLSWKNRIVRIIKEIN